MKNVLLGRWRVYMCVHICVCIYINIWGWCFDFFLTPLFWLTKCFSSLTLLREKLCVSVSDQVISWTYLLRTVGEKKFLGFVFAMSSLDVDPEYWYQGTNLKLIEINQKTDCRDNGSSHNFGNFLSNSFTLQWDLSKCWSVLLHWAFVLEPGFMYLHLSEVVCLCACRCMYMCPNEQST